MDLKPLYKSDHSVLLGLKKDFLEMCVLDGLVVEVDLNKRSVLGEPESGLLKVKGGDYIPIRQAEKKDYTRMIEKRLKKKLIKKIEEILETPPQDSVETLVWKSERFGGNGY